VADILRACIQARLVTALQGAQQVVSSP
jgi:hypothetical protein